MKNPDNKVIQDNKKIGVFGGSFDPIHKGHVHIALTFLKQLKLDKLLIIPSFIQPLKTDKIAINPKHRLKMAELAFNNYPNIIIENYEVLEHNISYTYKTLEFLKERERAQLYFLIGGDSAEDFPKWNNFHRILKAASPVIYSRPNFSGTGILEKMNVEVKYIQGKLLNISSTEIRKELKNKEKPKDLPDIVYEYIEENKIYK